MRFALALGLLALAPVAWAQDARAQDSGTTPWLPKTVASVQALDKVNARGSLLKIEVGQTATFGSLTIAVKACVVRPPDVPADAAAFLTVTDKNPNEPGFNGWMLKSTPAVSMLEHPIYDVRVVGCS